MNLKLCHIRKHKIHNSLEHNFNKFPCVYGNTMFLVITPVCQNCYQPKLFGKNYIEK